MSRGEVTGRKPLDFEPLTFSIRTFCAAHGISESMYFKLRTMGLGPDEMKVGARRIISAEAAARWRRDREAASEPAE